MSESLAPWDFSVVSCWEVRLAASFRRETSFVMAASFSPARTMSESSLKSTGRALAMGAARTKARRINRL